MGGVTIGAGVGIGYAAASALPLRLVGTRGYVASKNQVAQGNQALSQSFHYKRGDDPGIGIRIANWYTAEATLSVEAAPANPVSVSAAVEWPIGSPRTQLTFGGATTATVAAGADIDSDIALIAIPDGEKFLIFIKRTGASGLVNMFFGLLENSGDIMEYGTSVAKDVMSGVPVNTGTQKFGPLAIFTRSSRAAALLIGDSRMVGAGDIGDASGDVGEIARTIGGASGYVNLGLGSARAEGFGSISHARRIAVARDFCTHVYSAYGINDIRSGASAAVVAERLEAMFATLGLPACQATMPPYTTGAWTKADGSDQTKLAQDAARVSLNTTIRAAGLAGQTAVADVAGVVESGIDSGKWKADGTVQKYTADGAHETIFANLAIATAEVVPQTGTF